MSILGNVVRSALGRTQSAKVGRVGSLLPSDSRFDVAVVLTSNGGAGLGRAIRSVHDQAIDGRVQLLLGIEGSSSQVADAVKSVQRAPKHVTHTLVAPGYSSQASSGGLYSAASGSALRTALSFLANSRYICSLHDTDWFAANHLSSLLSVCREQAWAFTRRWQIDPTNPNKSTEDVTHSLGPGKGYYAARFGGWVHPSALMIDKISCHEMLPKWCHALSPKGTGADLVFFRGLVGRYPRGGDTQVPTVFTTNELSDAS